MHGRIGNANAGCWCHVLVGYFRVICHIPRFFGLNMFTMSFPLLDLNSEALLIYAKRECEIIGTVICKKLHCYQVAAEYIMENLIPREKIGRP